MEIKEIEYKDRIINLFGDIDEQISKETIEKIVNINLQDTEYINRVIGCLGGLGFSVQTDAINLPPIIINLSTYGGVCYDGFALCDSIKHSETSVNIVCYGKIMSMGIPILLSANYKVAHKNTTFMIHGVSGFNYGKAQQMKEDIEETNRLETMMSEYILANSKFPRKKMKEIIEKKQDYYFTAEEALKYKIIDEIIE